MKHNQIAKAAIDAGNAAACYERPDSPERRRRFHELYRYARERQFPPPETLARKFAELVGRPFPFASLAEAPIELQRFFTAFRAIAAALEPFREPDSEEAIAFDALVQPLAMDAPIEPQFVTVRVTFSETKDGALQLVEVHNFDGEIIRAGDWYRRGEYLDLMFTVHKSDIHDIPPLGGDFANGEPDDASQGASEDATAEAADGAKTPDGGEPQAAARIAVDETGPGEADPLDDPAADAGGAAPAGPADVEQRPAETKKKKK